jgi:hypothetical protein
MTNGMALRVQRDVYNTNGYKTPLIYFTSTAATTTTGHLSITISSYLGSF